MDTQGWGPVASCPPCRGPEPFQHEQSKRQRPSHTPQGKRRQNAARTFQQPPGLQTHPERPPDPALLARAEQEGVPHAQRCCRSPESLCPAESSLPRQHRLKGCPDGCQLCPFPPAAPRSAPKHQSRFCPRPPAVPLHHSAHVLHAKVCCTDDETSLIPKNSAFLGKPFRPTALPPAAWPAAHICAHLQQRWLPPGSLPQLRGRAGTGCVGERAVSDPAKPRTRR